MPPSWLLPFFILFVALCSLGWDLSGKSAEAKRSSSNGELGMVVLAARMPAKYLQTDGEGATDESLFHGVLIR